MQNLTAKFLCCNNLLACFKRFLLILSLNPERRIIKSTMTASFAPSLKHMTLTRIAVTICNEPEISCFIKELNYGEFKNAREGRWKTLMKKASEKVSELHVPPQLQQSILALIKPISLEIARFKYDHLELLGDRFDFQRCRLFWKPEGILDRRKTAEILARDEHICIINRFIIACSYFLENDAKKMCKGIICSLDSPFLADFWISYVEAYSNWSKLAEALANRLYRCAFVDYHKNHLWLRHFFDKLKPSEKKRCIEYTVKTTHKDHDNFRFCVSQLNKEQRESVFKENPLRLLRFLLDWPYQSLFSEAAEQMWKYLGEEEFIYLLYFIIYNRIVDDWNDFNYINLLKDFWQQSPEHLKDYTRNCSIYEPLKMVIFHDFSKPFPKEEIIRTSSSVDPPDILSPLFLEGDSFPRL